MHSLRLRLLLVTLIVSGVAIAAVALLSSRLTSRHFDRYVASDIEASLERYGQLLSVHYRERGGWADVQPLLDRIGLLAGRGLILVDGERRVIAAAPSQLTRASIEVTPEHRVAFEWRERRQTPAAGQRPVEEERVEKGVTMNTPRALVRGAQNDPVGILYLIPVNLQEESTGGRNESVFVGAVNRSLLVAAGIAALAALLATLLLARRILAPVEALTSAARRLELGDLGQRVSVESKDEIGELARAFNAMADALARTELLRRNMVNDIAHELRTPLTNIRCQIEALQDGLSRPTPEVLASLHEEVVLLGRLLSDLEELALAEAGKLRLERGPVPVAPVIDLALEALRLQAAQKGIRLEADIERNLPPADAAPERLGQILRNLLNNAITHTPAGGAIRIGACRVDSAIEIAVADTGPGVEPQHLPFIFERFYRADSSRARSTGGAGLGLAIVKQLVEAQGGRVSAKSEAGSGAIFLVTLPQFAPAPEAKEAPGHQQPPGSFTGSS